MAHARFEETQWDVGDLIAPDDYWMASWGPDPLSEVEDDSHCACCGQKLTWRVLVTNKETGEAVVLGRNCAKKAGLPGVTKSDKDLKVAIAHKQLTDPEFVRWAGFKPHPKGFRGSSLADDLRYWAGRKPERVFEAVRQFKAEGPVLAYNPEAPVLLTYGKKAAQVDVRQGWSQMHRLSGKCWVARITGTHPRFGLDREFVAREYGEDGKARFLTDSEGVYQFNSGSDRQFVELTAEGAKLVSEDEVKAKFE